MIVDAAECDLMQIEKLERQCFSSCWKYEQFLYELKENPFSFLKLIKDREAVIGYMDYWITFECCQLNKIAVMEQYRHKGYANMLMRELIKEAQKAYCETIMLEVRVSNTAARKLYESFDFIEANIRKGYYTDNGEDAMIMVKALGGIGSGFD